MASAMEEMAKLVSERKLEAAGELTRENWHHIIDIQPSQIDNLLLTFPPQEQSLIWLAALTVELKQQSNIDWSTLVSHMSTFTANFTPGQIYLHPLAFCDLIHQYTELLCVNRKAILGIASVRDAIKRYSPNDHTLTPIHYCLIQLCLAAKCIKPCLSFLDKDYIELLNEKSQLDSKHVVLFYYYGGMAYTCLHDYLRALQLFTMCLCVPAIAVSAVMLAAYKKYILVSLLKYGKLIPLPKCASNLVEKVFKNPCGPYLELAKAYANRDQVAMRQLVSTFTESYITEGNYGLVYRVKSQLVKHSVQRLTMSFLTLSLEDAALRVELNGANEMEKMLRDMIEDGEISASIDQEQNMIMFTDDQLHISDSNRVDILEKRLMECMMLQEELSKANKELALDPRYVQKSGTHSSMLDDDPLAEDHLM